MNCFLRTKIIMGHFENMFVIAKSSSRVAHVYKFLVFKLKDRMVATTKHNKIHFQDDCLELKKKQKKQVYNSH